MKSVVGGGGTDGVLGGTLGQTPQLIPQLEQEALKQATHSSRRQEGVKALLKREQPFKSHLHARMHIQADPLSQMPSAAQVSGDVHRQSLQLQPGLAQAPAPWGPMAITTASSVPG